MTQPLDPALTHRNRTTIWVSLWTHQQLVHLQQTGETLDETLQRVLSGYRDAHLIPSPEEI